jgi:hypothetical protein
MSLCFFLEAPAFLRVRKPASTALSNKVAKAGIHTQLASSQEKASTANCKGALFPKLQTFA